MTIPTAHGAAHAPNFPAKTPSVFSKTPTPRFGANGLKLSLEPC